MYKDVHHFLAKRKWAPTDIDSSVGGTTWIELFILFDTSASRSEESNHIKSHGAAQRASLRKGARAKDKKATDGEIKERDDITVRASYEEELARFMMELKAQGKVDVGNK